MDEPFLERLLDAMEDLRDGNFRRRLVAGTNGTSARIAEVFNQVAARKQWLIGELVRVRQAVAEEGRLHERLASGDGGPQGGWAQAIDEVNGLIEDLMQPTEELSRVLAAASQGDLSQRMTEQTERRPLRGEFARLATTVNGLLSQLSLFASEVTRVAREVGTEGKLGAQADVPGAAGQWRALTDSVNLMASNLTSQVRDISSMAGAVANGDLTQQITVNASGEVAALADTLNSMTGTLRTFAGEVTRVAREIGTEGRLGGQAQVPGVAGTWKDLTENVNFMAQNLTSQMRNIAEVTTAVATGDLSRKITVEVSGELLGLKNTVNTMVDQLSSFADEVTRVAREVGTEGILGGQAQVPGVAGTWRDLTESVNFMANNLTSQVRSIAEVTTAVAKGDLGKKITVDARGEIQELKNTVNTMVDQLSSFADEVTRVAREVGGDGRLGGQAQVAGVAGTWRDLTDNVNFMANNLTSQVRSIAEVTTAVAKGDLTQKITVDARGEILELKNTINTMVDQLSAFADEVTRVAREVGTDGKLGGQAQVRGVAGTWKNLTDNVNVMADNLTVQVRSIATVATAVAGGDLSKKIAVEAKGEVNALASTINSMVDTLRAFADEVTRVAREVGTEGILGGQATVPNVAGTWKDLTENVNFMADNLTAQVRNIAIVTTAVAKGDLSKKIDVDARGEILELKTTVNTMVDQLSSFAAEVTRVAREVGTDGKLGGQAQVEGVAGIWRRLTENVNQLAGNLTTQVRAIAAVATAVTAGDLTRQITVDAEGEMADLKDNINQMIGNLKATTTANRDQDWLKTNLARITSLMQGQRDLATVAQLIMSELTPVVSAQQGAFFLARQLEEEDTVLELTAGYGYRAQAEEPLRFGLGESLIGQVAIEKKTIMVSGAPPDYLRISSGLGSTAPVNVAVLPVLFEGSTLGVIELASVSEFTSVHQDLLEQLRDLIGVNVNTILANSRTDLLLAESQRLAQELRARSEQLQAQQEELQRSNTELAEKATLLATQNRDIEIKNIEIERGRQELEERAQQLSLASKYKSEFMANMSHELRTPLNSLLILAKLLADNLENNLTDKQVDYARTIHDAGSDLLQLINDILDLTKVEAGHLLLQPAEVAVTELVRYVEALCRPLTVEKGLDFAVLVDPAVPEVLHTDEHRLQQILRNLLSNAVKFTHEGRIRLEIRNADVAEVRRSALRGQRSLVAFAVQDTGIGIAADKLGVIFEAFQQADGTTSRKYGGTGLGLSISRELTDLLGGELQVRSAPGHGSTFTLILPVEQPNEITVPAVRVEPPAEPVIRSLAAGSGNGDPFEAEVPVPPRAPLPVRVRVPQEDGGSEHPVRFHGEKVLVVDDDLRNVFALTSVLELHGLHVVYADNGVAGVRALEQYDDIALVLMDIMMPELDGNATMAAIREMSAYEDLPIIAVTAKAMKGDREKSLASGATDYVTKPVDTEHLIRLIASYLDTDTDPLGIEA
ncbi:HAMP domain-containing protein [Crossiella cryophila]|uniref:Circadian input-output histidine kinase CikA n=2 Tax=Crossiella cryophila TaxID=43355 RepID=A0A7W7CA69_9PSEU|nr:HAMP domain-containing protein/signal transduction histidine kinase/CheY-like chemotaxis protein [Crossiella cryophila]